MPEDFVASYLRNKAYKRVMTQEKDMQVIPARHGTATFVPSGSTIKIVNTSGTQVIDAWAFALPNPPKSKAEAKGEAKKEEPKKEEKVEKEEPKKAPASTPKATPKKGSKKDKDMGLPSQEEAEEATRQFNAQQDAEAAEDTPKKSGWSSYIPSIYGSKKESGEQTNEETKAKTKENSRSWGTYFSAGQGFSSYIPSKDKVSTFASSHYRNPNKSYIEQLSDFSKTPVGAAGISALSGSGYGSALYAGYSAWNAENAPSEPAMEFMSMPHSRASTGHLTPRKNDTLVSNLCEPMLTIVEDTSPGVHDTLMAACDPPRYHELGVEDWDTHGSCAENLVLALKELNERAGLKGAKGIGADVTVNAVPAPLNLFMNIPWNDKGDISFEAPTCKKGDYIRLKAERDVVVVMSACPQDRLPINGKNGPQDGHFVVEEELDEEDEDVRTRLENAEKKKSSKRPPPKKLGSNGSSVNGAAKTPVKKTTPPAVKKPAAATKPSAKAPAKPAAKPAAKAPPKTQAANNGSSAAAPKKAESAGAATETAKAPVEKKKPRKLEKRGSMAPSASDAKSAATETTKAE